jgi:hypothetical protein
VVPYTVGAFGVLARERFTGEDSGAALPCTGVGRLSPAIRAARRAEELEVPKMAPAGSAAVGPGLEDVAADLELQREYKHFEVLVEVPAEYEAYGSMRSAGLASFPENGGGLPVFKDLRRRRPIWWPAVDIIKY